MQKLLAHISHLEITTPDVEASAAFYIEQFGMREVHRADGRVYLRCWGDYATYSLVVVPGAEPSLNCMAWRTTSAEALEVAAAQVEASGIQGRWSDGGYCYGRAYEFTGPYGHPMRLVWGVENYQAPEELASIYPDRPEKRSQHACAPSASWTTSQ